MAAICLADRLGSERPFASYVDLIPESDRPCIM